MTYPTEVDIDSWGCPDDGLLELSQPSDLVRCLMKYIEPDELPCTRYRVFSKWPLSKTLFFSFADRDGDPAATPLFAALTATEGLRDDIVEASKFMRQHPQIAKVDIFAPIAVVTRDVVERKEFKRHGETLSRLYFFGGDDVASKEEQEKVVKLFSNKSMSSWFSVVRHEDIPVEEFDTEISCRLFSGPLHSRQATIVIDVEKNL